MNGTNGVSLYEINSNASQLEISPTNCYENEYHKVNTKMKNE